MTRVVELFCRNSKRKRWNRTPSDIWKTSRFCVLSLQQITKDTFSVWSSVCRFCRNLNEQDQTKPSLPTYSRSRGAAGSPNSHLFAAKRSKLSQMFHTEPVVVFGCTHALPRFNQCATIYFLRDRPIWISSFSCWHVLIFLYCFDFWCLVLFPWTAATYAPSLNLLHLLDTASCVLPSAWLATAFHWTTLLRHKKPQEIEEKVSLFLSSHTCRCHYHFRTL